MRVRGAGSAVALVSALAVAAGGVAVAGYGPPGPGGGGGTPDAEVAAEGNPFSGGLAFDPAGLRVPFASLVRWTNTDALVPHTATERHNLWQLTGTYGVGSSVGFGPGESRQRVFDAGTFRYFCEVHPVEMKGVVRVPARVRTVVGRGEQRLSVRWGAQPLPTGQVFDVQRRLDGRWRMVREGTRARSGTFALDGGKFRSRVRLASDRAAASGWSPAAGP
jgi:plastocyanin